jgi:CRP-like cAMP-binding protein
MSDFFSYQTQAVAAAVPVADPPQTILAALSAEDWEHVIRFAARRRFPAGAVLFKAMQIDRALHFIASGQVEVTGQGSTRVVRGEGEVLGLMSFLDGAPSAVTATVTTAGPAELLRITPEALQQLMAWQPRVAMELMRDLGAHVAARLRRLQPAD